MKISREGSSNDVQMLAHQDHEHMHPHNTKQYQLQALPNTQMNFNPHIPQKLQSILYHGNLNQNEDDVMILQNLLSIIYHVSIMNQYPTPETFSYQYVKVDGHFGERTKQLVMKFQESAQMNVDGIVTDHLWKKLVHSYEKLQKEEQAKKAQHHYYQKKEGGNQYQKKNEKTLVQVSQGH